MMYSQALNETLSEQRPGLGPGPGLGKIQRPRGDVVTRRMWNRTFPGETDLLSGTVVGNSHGNMELSVSANHSAELHDNSQSKNNFIHQKTTKSRKYSDSFNNKRPRRRLLVDVQIKMAANVCVSPVDVLVGT